MHKTHTPAGTGVGRRARFGRSVAGLVCVGGLLFGGCATHTAHNMAVNSTFSPGERPGLPSYVLVFNDRETQQLVAETPGVLTDLTEALADRGYRPVEDDEEASMAVSVEYHTFFSQKVQRRPVLVENPQSVRHKNIAAMVGGGRYTELLNPQPSQEGTVHTGPSGEIITIGPRGELIQGAVDPRYMQEQSLTETRTYLATNRILALRGWKVPASSEDADPEIIWEVTSALTDTKKPVEYDLATMMASSLSFIERETGDLLEVQLPR